MTPPLNAAHCERILRTFGGTAMRKPLEAIRDGSHLVIDRATLEDVRYLLEQVKENWNDKPCSMKVNLPSRAHETYPANYAHTAASLLLAQLPEKPQ